MLPTVPIRLLLLFLEIAHRPRPQLHQEGGVTPARSRVHQYYPLVGSLQGRARGGGLQYW